MASTLVLAIVIALLMSTQYLFQPFVWRLWPVDEVLLGWLEVARDRVVVAAMIALAIIVATKIKVRPTGYAREALLVLAILAGATAGEALLAETGSALARGGVVASLGRILQWTVFAICACGTYVLWRRADRLETAARAARLSQSRAQAALVETQLYALRQQIEPHFLFNTLATASRLQEHGSGDADRLLAHLESYLRATTPTHSISATIADEASLVDSYLAIVAIRMSGRLEYRLDVPRDLASCECPAFSLATLVENAVKHGIMATQVGGGSIVISARRDGEMVEAVVADNGAGMLGTGARVAGTGIGLSNTRARLRALYGARASLTLEANTPSGVRAVMRFPAAGVMA